MLKAADWLGAARGTLSTEADARSCCGTVVRDTQQVTESIYTRELANQTNALAEADDTLVIDLADIPIEADLRYMLLVSLLIEGDWDPSNGDTLRGGHQEEFNAACRMRWWLDSFPADLTTTRSLVFQPRALDSYRIVGAGVSLTLTGTEVMTWRAYAQDATTVEFLIDQIYFVPYYSQIDSPNWDSDDFEIVPGQWSSLGTIGGIGDGFVDGADGGDDNGKFTWHPIVVDEPTGLSGGDGGGDYQKEDNEYMACVRVDDLFLQNSQTNAEAPAHCYGIHGPFYVPEQVWTLDDFSRTAGDGNFAGADGHFATQSPGNTPEGFGWRVDDVSGPATELGVRIGSAVWVDGAELAFEHRSGGLSRLSRAFLRSYGGEDVPNAASAIIQADNLILSGTFHADVTAGSAAGLTLNAVIGTELGLTSDNPQAVNLVFDLKSGDWMLGYGSMGGTSPSAPISLTGYTLGDVVAFKIEVKRYIARIKVWDAGGSEPGTWDIEEFRPIWNSGYLEYDYGDDLEFSIRDWDTNTVMINYTADSTPVNQVIFRLDDLTAEHDPVGTNESAWASIEQPEGTERGRIEMPAGCQHLVYWGTRDWTTLDFGFPYLDYSAKVWNDSGAAELQRSEAVWWWFRAVHSGIVPMNWRSADRSPRGQQRILAGG